MLDPKMQRFNSIYPEPKEQEIYENPYCNRIEHNQQVSKVNNSDVRQLENFFSECQTITPSQIIQSKKYSEAYNCKVHLVKQNLHASKTAMIRIVYAIFLKNREQILRQGACFVYQQNNTAYALAWLSNRQKFKCKIYVPNFIGDETIEELMKAGSQTLSICQQASSYQECEKLISSQSSVNFDFNLHPNQAMNGAATIAKQILDRQMNKIDIIIVPQMCGTAPGIASYFKQNSQSTKVYVVNLEAKDGQSPRNLKNMILFKQKMEENKVVSRKNKNYFKGLQQSSNLSQKFIQAAKTSIDGFINVQEKNMAETVVRIYSMGIISQPSGVLPIAALTKIAKRIEGKNVLCLLTQSRIDFMEIERARQLNQISKGKKFKIRVKIPNKRKSIHDLLSRCFLKNEVVTAQYVKKTSRQENNVIICFESSSQQAFQYSMQKILSLKFHVENITEED